MNAVEQMDIIKNIRHVGIVVEDVPRALMFYQNLLGLVVQHSAEEAGSFIDGLLGLRDVRVHTIKMSAPEGPTLLELLKYDHPEIRVGEHRTVNTLGLTHVAITVHDLQSTWHKLSHAGVKFINPPQTAPSGNAKVCYCQDFDGNFLELVEMLQPQIDLSAQS